MTTTVVAGGAGFIGSHLCERLLGMGHRVIALDSLTTGRTTNIEHLFDHTRFSFVRHDVREGPIPVDEPIDLVMNLASPASPIDFLTKSVEILETRRDGEVAEEAVEAVRLLEGLRDGRGVAGVYTREVAETKAKQAVDKARARNYPLLVEAEPE